MSRSPLNAVYLLAVYLVLSGPALAESVGPPVQEGFLSVDLAAFEVIEEPGGIDLVFVAPGAFEKLGEYEGMMIDQPEIWIDDDSPYGGEKPDNLKALADLVRDRLIGRMVRAGYSVVELPGPGVVYFRIALTDLYLMEREEKLTDYTEINPASKSARELMEKVDIIEMVLQAELLDSVTNELLGAIVISRGARAREGQPQQSMNLEEFQVVIREYGARIRCRFDNGKRPKEEWIDCSDTQARVRATGY
jgi:hypothetical protein